ncbi:GNAT family N-acetyltransferase [Pseudomonas muyukensis]|uniref:GNAT family N-acetyltransferase n=1 Tax=Pseudomonas muyukensis TaxID=2842357 RepID=A0ABX8MER2_9PSED|nr:GNAT family N-acetyltransferase [Pseudomonas muyukensis]QXH37112.1 GNAT family N-acetyltransferase [Pseudomonas muyukensis]
MKLERQVWRDDSQARVFAELHIRAFPGFFLSQLGVGFLTLLYSHYLRSEQCYCVAAYDESRPDLPLGLVVAIHQPSLFYKALFAQHRFAFAWRAVPSLLKQPLFVARKLFAAVFYRGDQVESLESERAVLLSTISVAPEAQGRGLGKKLLQCVDEWTHDVDGAFVYLTTDRDANEQVNAFYQSNGYVLESTLKKSGGRYMNRYVKHVR